MNVSKDRSGKWTWKLKCQTSMIKDSSVMKILECFSPVQFSCHRSYPSCSVCGRSLYAWYWIVKMDIRLFHWSVDIEFVQGTERGWCNAYALKAFEVGKTLSVFELITLLMDAFSHACDENLPITFFPPIRSDSCSGKLKPLLNWCLLRWETSKIFISKITHDFFVYLPVLELENTQDGWGCTPWPAS